MSKQKQLRVVAGKRPPARLRAIAPYGAQARRGRARRKARLLAGARRVRVKLGDAMRSCGLDETKLADKFDSLVDRLSKKTSRSDKLLLEVLKECCKLLEAYPAQRGASAEPVPVQFIANVPRPERQAAMGDAQEIAPAPETSI
jgi:hypothetical protein